MSITPQEIHQLCEEVSARPVRNYYLRRSTRLGRFRCALSFLVLGGHEFEHIWSRDGDLLETVGESALVCRVCWKAEDVKSFVGFRPNYVSIGFGGRRQHADRQVGNVTAELKRLGADA